MQDVFLVYTVAFLIAGIVSFILTSAFLFSFRRRCTNIEWSIGDLQQRASSFRGKELADKRWGKEKAFNEEVAQILQTTPAARRKYDNDPLGE